MNENTTGRPIESIDSKYIMSIILFLHENGPSRKTEIYENVGRNSNMPRRIQQIIDCGILEEERSIGCSIYNLTESGRKIAKHLASIEDLIS